MRGVVFSAAAPAPHFAGSPPSTRRTAASIRSVRGSRAIAGLLLLLSAARVWAGSTESSAAADQDCSLPAERWATAQALSWLGRQVRELRANALQEATWQGQRVVVTLHHERLALMEALLAAPQQLSAPDPRWAAARVLTPFVELVAPQPVPALDRASVSVVVTDERGRRYRVPFLTRRERSGGVAYRLPLVGPLALPEVGPLEPASLFRLTVQLRSQLEPDADEEARSGDSSEPLRLQWALAPRALAALDREPPFAPWARFRALRSVRAALLRGALPVAHGLLGGALGCDRTAEAEALRSAAALTLAPLPRNWVGPARLARDASAPARQAVRAWLLRLALARELAPAVQRGLLPLAQYRRLQGALRGAADALQGRPPSAVEASSGDPAAALPELLHRFDAALADALVEAFAAPLAAPTPHVPAELVELLPRGELGSGLPVAARRELEQRVALAQLALRPWRQPPVAQGAGSAGGAELAAFGEQRLVLRGPPAASFATAPGEVVIARARAGLGPVWGHAGLPAPPTAFSVVDRAARYWRRQAQAAPTRAALAALARRMLARALTSADPGLALRIRAALAGQAPVAPAFARDPELAPAGPPVRPLGAAALRRALDARRPPAERQAATLALARGARPRDPLLTFFAGLAGDGDPLVRGAALLGEARCGKAEAWLALGGLARRGPCALRGPALEALAPRLDPGSRHQLLLALLRGTCEAAGREAWRAVLRWHAGDLELLRAGLSQRAEHARIEAALSVVATAAVGGAPEHRSPE